MFTGSLTCSPADVSRTMWLRELTLINRSPEPARENTNLLNLINQLLVN
jgi:hypothetical protein